MRISRRTTWSLLLAGAATILALVAVVTARPQATPSTVAATAAAAAATPAGLPPGEIQSITEQNGGRVIVVRAAQPVPVGDGAEASDRGMTAYIDPATGKFREPSAEEAAALAAAGRLPLLRRLPAQEQLVKSEAGGIYLKVDEGLMTNTVAHRAEDGSVVIGHAQGHDEAEKAVKASGTPAGKEHRHDR